MHTRRVGASSWVLALAAICAVAGSALSFTPPGDNHDYEVHLRPLDRLTPPSAAALDAGRQATERLTRSYEGNWRVYSWNEETGTPRWIYGSGAQLSASFATPNEVVAAARDVIRSNPEAFRADLNHLRFFSAPRGAGKQAVHFQQTHEGLDVWGGRVSATFTDGGRLIALGSTYYPNVQVDPTPTIDRAAARELARLDLPFNPATDSVEERPDLLVLPVPGAGASVTHHLVWRVRVRTSEPIGIWVTHVDAHDGTILWRYNDVHFVDFTGTTSGLIQRPTFCEGQTEETLPYLRVTVSGVGTTNADGNGDWTVPFGGTGDRTVTADLYSPYVDVNNLKVGGSQGAFSGTATAGVPFEVAFTDDNSQRDEKDVYRAVNDIHDFFQQFAPEFNYANQRIVANVSRNQTCNAYWDGTINFYAAGGGCANTGEIMDVVHHEFGHGVQWAILGWQGNEGLGEGNGDALGNMMVLSPIVGRGFYNNCASGIRNSENSLRYPEDVVGQGVHNAGRVIAGFHWDALEGLMAVHGTEAGRLIAATNWHYGRVLNLPTNQPDQVLATFITDDDDGDLTNGTPNYEAYCLAAANHGFDCPEVLIGLFVEHTAVGSREETGPVNIDATIRTTEGTLVADSLRVHYRLNGGPFQSVMLEPYGGPDGFRGVIPSLAPPVEVEYYLRARDTAGNVRTHPSFAPANLHAFDVATEFDPMEVESGWTVNLEGTDNATTGAWVRVDPNGTAAQPEDDYTAAPGTMCWVTGNAPPGSGDGVADVDGGTTTLYSPVYNLAGAASARAKFFRWYSNDQGGAPASDNWTVEARNNGGPWQQVERTMESSNAWVDRDFDLVAAFGGELGDVQLRFIASDLEQGSLIEAAVDDFEILAHLTSGVEPQAGGPPRFALLGASPNPLTGAGRFAFMLPAEGKVRLALYDVSGRQLRLLADGQRAGGRSELLWDGLDAGGRAVPSGVYFLRMEAPGFRASRPVVVAR